MSDEYDDLENEGGEGIKNLRKQYNDQKKQLDELLGELNGYRAEKRATTVTGILKAKGIPEAAAKFYNSEDVSEDAVGKWAEENASLFGVQPQVQQEQSGGNPAFDSINRMAEVTSDNGSAPSAQPGQRVYGDPAAIAHALQTLPIDELVKQGYFKTDPRKGF